MNMTTMTANNSEQKCADALADLVSDGKNDGMSKWTRKSKLLMLEGELNQLEMSLLEFDVALKFNEARELAKSAEKLFQADKSNERIRHRIGQLFSSLLSATDKHFSQDLVGELSMETMQEMFFFAFPDQRNSTRGSLQVYLIWATNQPQSLRKIATKLFAYYLGASGEFQQQQKLAQLAVKSSQLTSAEEEVTPMDAVLFHLFESLVKADFGDLSLHNILQLFHTLLRNCFADSMGRLEQDFYAQSRIPFLAAIPRPAVCWHLCLHVLVQLFERRSQTVMAQALRPLPDSVQAISLALDKAMGDPGACQELLQSAEFVRLILCWSLASPLKDIQTDVTKQVVCLPANVFWVTPSALEHYWLYNLEPDSDDSPAEIEELQQPKSGGLCQTRVDSIGHLNTLFSSSPVAEQQFVAISQSLFSSYNLRSTVVLALMLSENWKKAAELIEHFLADQPSLVSSADRSLLRLQQLQTLLQLRQLQRAFSLCIELIGEFVDFGAKREENNANENGNNSFNDTIQPPQFPIVVGPEIAWVRLAHSDHLRLFLLLLLFHICWLSFAKCSAQKFANAESAEFVFLALIVVAQSCWTDFGFGLFEQLCELVAIKDQFRCPFFFRYVSNPVLMDELLGLHFVQMALAPAADGICAMAPREWHKSVIEGTVKMAEGSAMGALEQFLAEHRQRISDLL